MTRGAVGTVEGGEAREALDVAAVHARHGGFVWVTLQRLGVRAADLPDQHQEVFVVVHRRLHTFDGTARMTTWLFGICMRVAAAYRRRAHVRREEPREDAGDDVADGAGRSPEQAAQDREARARLAVILDAMPLEQRAVFVMFEIDELGCDEIAAQMGVPLGTVYSRLRAARQAFERAVARLRARDGSGGPR